MFLCFIQLLYIPMKDAPSHKSAKLPRCQVLFGSVLSSACFRHSVIWGAVKKIVGEQKKELIYYVICCHCFAVLPI